MSASRPASTAVELRIAGDMARRGALATPFAVLAATLWRGSDGAATALLGMAIVLGNVLLAAVILDAAARISPHALLGAALGGYLLRLAVLAGVVVAVRHLAWLDRPVFAATVVVAELGLLVWEARAVSQTLVRSDALAGRTRLP